MTLQIYTADEAAVLLGCSAKTVEEWARTGLLPGIKPGGSWVFPAGALAQRLDELALEEAAQRRKAPTPTATLKPQAPPARPGRKTRVLPRLVDLRGA
jgi:excisionase family DNA binding protein